MHTESHPVGLIDTDDGCLSARINVVLVDKADAWRKQPELNWGMAMVRCGGSLESYFSVVIRDQLPPKIPKTNLKYVL